MWLYILTGIPVFSYILMRLYRFYNKGNNDYWPSRGVKLVLSSEIPEGFGKAPNMDGFYYNRHPDARFVGSMEINNPILFIRDPDLVKKITVKDFNHFVNRRKVNFGGDFSDAVLFNLDGSRWKNMRAYITPMFTSGKIRRMFDLFAKSAKDLTNYVERKGEKGSGVNVKVIETRETFGRFAMDVIGSTAFGIDSCCLTDDHSMFYKMGIQLQETRGLKVLFFAMLPKIAYLLKLDLVPKKPLKFFRGTLNWALNARRQNFLKKNQSAGGPPSDFLQLMIEAQHAELKDELKDNDARDGDDLAQFERDAKVSADTGKKVQITDLFVLSNSFTFIFGGFDNTEAVMTVAAYHLAVYPEMQKRLRAEVDEFVGEQGGQVTYDGVGKMTYLDMFISECLRLYPPITRFEREVTQPYTIPATDSSPQVTLPVGLLCIFSVYGFHLDSKYYPNPTEFDPERFSAENRQKRHPYVYMPFGLGPRSCIAMRFVLTELKAAIAHLVYNFEVRTCDETIIPLKMNQLQGQFRPAVGLKVALVKRR